MNNQDVKTTPNTSDSDLCRIIVSGDSISKGIVWDETRNRYLPLAQNYLSILTTKLKCSFFNAAQFGNTLPRGGVKLGKDVNRLNPDFVILEYGGNDCDFKWDEVAQNPQGSHTPKTDIVEFEQQLTALVQQLRDRQITPMLMTLPPLDADRYFKWVTHNNPETKEKILTWIGNVTRIYWWQERYNSAIMTVAEKMNADLIDVRSAFLMEPDFRKSICLDGIHPNQHGHNLIADKIMEFMQRHYRFLVRKAPVTVAA